MRANSVSGSLKVAAGFVALLALSQQAEYASAVCSGNDFTCCNTGDCISSSWVGDNDNDCGDDSDEYLSAPGCDQSTCFELERFGRPCGSSTTTESPPISLCSNGQFECCNGKCTTSSYINDGDNDCGDYSDEPKSGGTGCSCKPNNGDLVGCFSGSSWLYAQAGDSQTPSSNDNNDDDWWNWSSNNDDDDYSSGSSFNAAYLVGPVIFLVIIGSVISSQKKENAGNAGNNNLPLPPVPVSPVARPTSARSNAAIYGVQMMQNPYGGGAPAAAAMERFNNLAQVAYNNPYGGAAHAATVALPSYRAVQAQPLPAAPSAKPFEDVSSDSEDEQEHKRGGGAEAEWYWTTFGMQI